MVVSVFSGQANFKVKLMKRSEESLYILVKWKIQKKCKNYKHICTKYWGPSNTNTIIVGVLDSTVLPIGQQKYLRNIRVTTCFLNQWIQQIPTERLILLQQNTLFSSVCRTFSKTQHILVHEACLNKYKRNKILQYKLLDDCTLKQEINHKINQRNVVNPWILHNMLLNIQYVKKEIREETKLSMELNDNAVQYHTN